MASNRQRSSNSFSSTSLSALPVLDTTRKEQSIFSRGRPPWYKEDGKATQAFVIGICGGSASGKTSVAERIIADIDVDWVVLVSMDSFYKELTEAEKEEAYRSEYNFDHPDAFDVDLLVNVLCALKAGRSVEIPVYDFGTHSRKKETRKIYGANVIIFEGIMAFCRQDLKDLMDLKVFVDTDADVRLARRLKRDICERNRDLIGVIDQYDRFVRPSFDQFIKPSIEAADIVIPRGLTNTVAIDLVTASVQKQLRDHGLAHRKHMAQSALPTDQMPSTLTVLPSTPQILGMQTLIRDRTTDRDTFVYYAHRLSRLVVEEAHSFLPYDSVTVETPTLAPFQGTRVACRLVGVSILRAGVTMERALREVYKDIPIGKILIQSDPDSGEPGLHYYKLPRFLENDYVFLTDATIATGSAAIMAIRVLLDHGIPPERIALLSLISARAGVASVAYAFPEVRIVTANLDDRVNDQFHILPGVGNFGDRYFGTEPNS